MQEKRITFYELCDGLAEDKKYGPNCQMLLEECLKNQKLTLNNFQPAVSSLGCHNMLMCVWLGYEGLPFYFPGKEHPAKFNIDGIKPMSFLEEIDCRKVEIRKIDLAHFLFMKDLPLPAPDVKDRFLWFHGNPASTEVKKIGEDPYDVHDQDLWNLINVYEIC